MEVAVEEVVATVLAVVMAVVPVVAAPWQAVHATATHVRGP